MKRFRGHIDILEGSEAAGCKSNVVSCLRSLPLEDLLAMTQQFPRWKPVLDSGLGTSLSIMPLDQLTALLTGQYKGHHLRPPVTRVTMYMYF